MENETTAAIAALGDKLGREIETLRTEVRSGISGMHTDVKTLVRDMERLTTEVVRVQRDIHYFRLSAIEDYSSLRMRLDGLRTLQERHMDERRTLDDLAGRIARIERKADRKDLGTAAML
jgi:hypothetical protein